MRSLLRTLLLILFIIGISVPIWVFVVAREPTLPAAPPRELGPVPVGSLALAPVGVERTLRVFGNLEARQRVALACELGGRLERVHPEWAPGTKVKKGDLCFALAARSFQLDRDRLSAALEESEAAVTNAEVEFERAGHALEKAIAKHVVATREHERQVQLGELASESLRDQSLSVRIDAELGVEQGRSALDAARSRLSGAEARRGGARAALELAAETLEKSRVKASIEGEFTTRAPVPGRLLAAGESVGEIVDLTTLILSAQVPESDLIGLERGLRARVILPDRPETAPRRELIGTLLSLPAEVDPVTRHGVVRIEVPNPDVGDESTARTGRVPSGFFAEASIELRPSGDALWIDRRHFRWRSGTPLAFVLVDGHAEERRLLFSAEHGEGFLVAQGLEAGETLITEPLERVVDGTPVRPRDEPRSAR